MDHEYAADHQSVERYLLGELNEREREEFEEHYFSCPECAEAVRSGAYFSDNTRSVLKETSGLQKKAARAKAAGVVTTMNARPRPTLWHSLSPPLGIAAAALLAILGYQRLTADGHERPHMLARTVLEPAARGEEKVVARKPGQKSVVLKIDVNSEKPFPHYRVDIETPSGKSIMDDTGDKGADGALEVEVPSAELPPGHYILMVHGQDEGSASTQGSPSGPEITRSRFVVTE